MMANTLMDKGRDHFATKDIDWIDDDIRILLLDTNFYTVNVATHETVADIPSAAIVSEALLIGRATNGAGTCDATNPTFPSVTGAVSEAAMIYKRVADGSGSRIDNQSLLIAYIDTAPGLPVTPVGSDINVTLSDQGIFRL